MSDFLRWLFAPFQSNPRRWFWVLMLILVLIVLQLTGQLRG